jgi:heat-inducible transcriptional repressor
MAAGDLNNRARRILHALVNEYIATGEPVGSRTLSRKHDLSLSPASIRNVMSDLEELGYLLAPHTSAGRVPTDKGLRFFVDCLIKVRDLPFAERERIAGAYGAYEAHDGDGLAAGEVQAVGDVMQTTSRLLAELTQHAGVVLAPRLDAATFQHIEFVRLTGDQVLAVLVTSGGQVQNRLLRMANPPDPVELERYGNYLNDILVGLTLHEVRERVMAEMGREQTAYNEMVSRALQLGTAVLDAAAPEAAGSKLYIDGQIKLLDEPEFGDTQKLKTLLRAFEEKSQIIRLLDSTLEAKGIQIFIGAETPYLETKDCAVVTASYGASERTLGTLGVIGPARMNYSRVIPLVECTARIISSILERGL